MNQTNKTLKPQNELFKENTFAPTCRPLINNVIIIIV